MGQAPPPALHPKLASTEILLGLPIALTVLGMMILVPMDVIGRSLFHAPIPGTYELIELMLSVVVFGGLPFVSRAGEQVGTLVYPSFWTGRRNTVRVVLVAAITMIALALLGKQIWAEALSAQRLHAATQALRISLAPVYYFMAVMAWIAVPLTAVHAASALLRKEGRH